VALNTFRELRPLEPERQIEAAQLMVAISRYTIGYAR
jgi:hypothetical protein